MFPDKEKHWEGSPEYLSTVKMSGENVKANFPTSQILKFPFPHILIYWYFQFSNSYILIFSFSTLFIFSLSIVQYSHHPPQGLFLLPNVKHLKADRYMHLQRLQVSQDPAGVGFQVLASFEDRLCGLRSYSRG